MIETAQRKEPARRRKDPSKRPAAIEVEIDGVVARIGRGADAATIAAVVEALKAHR